MTEQDRKLLYLQRLSTKLRPEIKTMYIGQRFKNAERTGDDKAAIVIAGRTIGRYSHRRTSRKLARFAGYLWLTMRLMVATSRSMVSCREVGL